MSDAGKGDKRRPMFISREKFNSNWDNVFNKKEKIDNECLTECRVKEKQCSECGGTGRAPWPHCVITRTCATCDGSGKEIDKE